MSNAQIFLQKTKGWWQFYIQPGAYTLPALATPFLSTSDTMKNFFGPVPVAYLKLRPGKNTSILMGGLPTVMGAVARHGFRISTSIPSGRYHQKCGVAAD